MQRYISSRDPAKAGVESHKAILSGLAKDGGLYTPYPVDFYIDPERIRGKTYQEIALEIMSKFLDDYSREELRSYISGAYDSKFDTQEIVPTREVPGMYLMELWHGPTSAFKDLALTILPYLMSGAMRKSGDKKKVCILTATSGDTGKAALSGFADVKGTEITVLYPEIGVSDIQKLQMQTSEGNNVYVLAVNGNFDDCQRIVKEFSTNGSVRNSFRNIDISSANSINIGRLVPQIVYYFKSYSDLVSRGKIKCGDTVNFVVPTGNFGDILAGYYAKYIGLPISRLVCASNSNHVLTDFFNTGTYSVDRPFHTTISPSMDILISSNLERLLFSASHADTSLNLKLMNDLAEKKSYELPGRGLAKLQEIFSAYYATEDDCRYEIKRMWDRNHVLIDPHTAVAVHAAKLHRELTGDDSPAIVLSTASPYKFSQDVLKSLIGSTPDNAFEAMEELHEYTGVDIPANLRNLKNKRVRFTKTVEVNEAEEALFSRLEDISNA